MFATRKARLALACVLLTALVACSRKHDSNDFLPSAPEFQAALQITNPAEITVPADGVSTVKIEAQISPDANVSRTVRFETTLGSWVEPATAGASAQRVGGAAVGLPQSDLTVVVEKEADTSGKAAAFLQSTKTEGRALVTVSVIKKDGNATSVVVSETREVVFAQVTDALTLTLSPSDTAFADGTSEILLEATITAGQPSTFKTVTFATTFGSLDGQALVTGTTASASVNVPTDSTRVARARLTSAVSGTGSVTATIMEYTTATISRFVTFQGQNPNTIQLSASPGQVPADGESLITVTATVDVGLVPKVVTFNTSAGTFTTGNITAGMEGKETKANTDASNQAIVQLQSGDEINPSVLLTATITVANVARTANTTVAFVEIPSGELSINPANLDFGTVTQDEFSDLPLTLGNHSTEASLTVQEPEIGGTDAGNFSLHQPPAFPVTIEPQGSVALTVRFEPDAVAESTATLTIMSDDTSEPETGVVVNLDGEGVAGAPNIVVEPTSLAFPDVPSAGSAVKTVMIKNTGSADLSVTDIVSSGGEFVLDPVFAAFDVEPGSEKPVNVRFTPGGTSSFIEVLTISSTDQPDKTVQLTGNGI